MARGLGDRPRYTRRTTPVGVAGRGHRGLGAHHGMRSPAGVKFACQEGNRRKATYVVSAPDLVVPAKRSAYETDERFESRRLQWADAVRSIDPGPSGASGLV